MPRRRPRGSQRRSRKSTILLVCEGEATERFYFDQLKREDAVRERFTVKIRGGNGGSHKQIVERAVAEKSRNPDTDETWCIMDVESMTTPQDKARVNSALALATRENINISLSNPAFEVWLLAHFIQSSRQYQDCDSVIRDLNCHWNRNFQRNYSKTDVRIYEHLKSRMNNAIANARHVHVNFHRSAEIQESNSSTSVYELVEKLLGG